MARVLVVEDDADILALVTMLLRKNGHEIAGVGSASEALDHIKASDTPDVVILDVGLPGTDGLHLLPMLREQTERPDLPAIFLSARVQESDVAAGRALDAVYLTKPIATAALLAAVDRAVMAPSGERWPRRATT